MITSTVTRNKPLVRVAITDDNLATYTDNAETALYLRRVGVKEEFVKYLSIQTFDNQVVFLLDDLFFSSADGLYEGRVVYKGVTVGYIRLRHKKKKAEVIVLEP